MKMPISKLTRAYSEDINWFTEIAALRKGNKIDKEQMKSARAIRAMRNLIESNPIVLRKFKELPLR